MSVVTNGAMSFLIVAVMTLAVRPRQLLKGSLSTPTQKRRERSMHRRAVQEGPSRRPYPYQRPRYLRIRRNFHDDSSDQIVSTREAAFCKDAARQKPRPDRWRRLLRYRGRAGAQASQCRNNADRPA